MAFLESIALLSYDPTVPNVWRTPSVQKPSGTVTKKFVYTPGREDGMATPGETIEYTIVASNDGNVDLVHFNLANNMSSTIGGKTYQIVCNMSPHD